MRSLKFATIASSILLISATKAFGDQASPTITYANPGSDKTNYLSDLIKFNFDINVLKIDTTKEPYTSSPGCALAFTTLKGIGKLQVNNKPHPAFRVTDVPDDESTSRCGNIKIKKDDVIVVMQEQIESTPPDRYGMTYGSLLVPYKYHIKGDKTFSGSASLGGYIGFRQDRSGITGLALQYIGFLGASSIQIPQIVNGESTSQSVAGASYGVGILGKVKDDFNLGVVLGWDKVGSGTIYKNNDRAWLAVSLGYSFSN